MLFFNRNRRHISAIRAMVSWLDENRFGHVLIGGFAASTLGRPRFTQDVDFLADISQGDWEIAVKQARRFGLRVLFDDSGAPSHRSKIIQLRHAGRGDIDLIIAGTVLEREIIDRAFPLDIQSIRCKVITPEDLIILKLIAGRPQDIIDCDNLLDFHPRLDWDRIDSTLTACAGSTKNPNCLAQLDALKQKAKQ